MWDAVSSQSIIRGFKKCCVSNALDGSEGEQHSGAEDVCEGKGDIGGEVCRVLVKFS